MKQDDVLAPLLFTIYLAALHTILRNRPKDTNLKVPTQLNGNVFDLTRLRTKKKIFQITVLELLHVDDNAMMNLCNNLLQESADRWVFA